MTTENYEIPLQVISQNETKCHNYDISQLQKCKCNGMMSFTISNLYNFNIVIFIS